MWILDTDALTVLDTHGSPFGTRAFRSAVVATLPDLHDVSFGARARDGTLAAVALIARRRFAESVPPSGYGGVVATRQLASAEIASFVDLASRELRLRRLWIRWLELGPPSGVGRGIGKASVVPIELDEVPSSRYSRLARRSLRRSEEAGTSVVATSSADAFWPVYANAARDWKMRYPEPLVRRLLQTGVARIHAVSVGDRIVASLLTLVNASHWMCWLAAQTDEGRAIAASYRAYDALLAEAHAAGVAAVNLGVSVGGGAEFKQHLGAREFEMREWLSENLSATATRLARRIAGNAVSRARAAKAKIA
jgi:Acetyltransferase (GNAT) domain